MLIREKRLGAIGAYLGDVAPLVAELLSGQSADRIRTFAQSAPDDLIRALAVLGAIRGTAIVVHGARGCSAALTRFAPQGAWAVTNLDQRDTILGSETILSDTVRALVRRHRPWAVFIVATPVIAINNDDIRAAALELSEELDIPVIEVRTDGFRSRIAATGFDAAAQAVLQLVPPAEQARRDDLVNLLATQAGPGLVALERELQSLGLTVNRLPHAADAEGFRRAATAALSVTVDPDSTAALGDGLAAVHGVPLLRLPPPVGTAATNHFVAAIAAATGRTVPAGIEASGLETLSGRRVAVAAAPATAFALGDLIVELEGELVGISVDHIDRTHIGALQDFAVKRPDLPLHVADGQPFEHANRLRRLAPDLFIGPADLAALAARSGIPALSIDADELLGYRGVARLARRASRALGNTALVQRLAGGRGDYQPGWFKRSPDWYIKLEVK
nr:nitrogenase component 1 [Rhodopseudomonas rhenobacensis]